jgi:hypothetical protein
MAVQEFNTFLNRGKGTARLTHRHVSIAQSPLGSREAVTPPRSSAGSGSSESPVELGLFSWVSEHGLEGEIQILGVRRDAPLGTSTELAIIFFGVEILLEVADEMKANPIVIQARTRCHWREARRHIQKASSGSPTVHDFMHAMHVLFRGDVTECNDAVMPCNIQQRFQEEAGSSIQDNSYEVYSENDVEEDEDCFEESLAHAFHRWLESTPPLFRFEHASRGKAWEFPLTKAEKKELLILHFNQVVEQQARIKVDSEEKSVAAAPRCRSSTGGSSTNLSLA